MFGKLETELRSIFAPDRFVAPILAGTSSSETTPPAYPFQAATLSAYGGPNYMAAS